MSSFNPSNEEGTCLWCGKKLIFFCHTEWENTGKEGPDTCHYCDCKAEKGEPDPDEYEEGFHFPGYRCPKCHRPVIPRKIRKVASRRRFWDKPGYAGSGYFCTLRCGHSFAVDAARNGYRFKPKER
jgi:hypothetical protein